MPCSAPSNRTPLLRQYVQSAAAGGGGSAADEIAHLAQLRDQGVISDAEFQQAKAKALS